jgi:hypothetical protein
MKNNKVIGSLIYYSRIGRKHSRKQKDKKKQKNTSEYPYSGLTIELGALRTRRNHYHPITTFGVYEGTTTIPAFA